MSPRRFWLVLFAITVAALVGRVAYALTVIPHTTHSLDEPVYEGAAVSLGEGRGFTLYPYFGAPHRIETADHAPLTSIVLAPIARISGNDEDAMRVMVAVVGVGVVVLVGLLGRDLGGPRTGLVAAGLAAIYPNLWSHDGLLMSETFAALGTVATILCVRLLIRTPNWRIAGATGLACAIAMLSRGELVLLVPVLVLPAVLGLRRFGWPRRLQLFGVVVCAAALVLAPWVAYNLSRFERPVFISYTDGGVIAGANCDRTYSGALFGFWDGRCHPRTSKAEDPSAIAARARDDGVDYVGAHLDRFPLVIVAREGRVWGVHRIFPVAHIAGETEGIPTEVTWAGWAMYWILILLAVAARRDSSTRVSRCGRSLRLSSWWLSLPRSSTVIQGSASPPRSRWWCWPQPG